MAAPLTESIKKKCDVWCDFCFTRAKKKTGEIYRTMRVRYGDNYTSQRKRYKCVKRFTSGTTNVVNDERSDCLSIVTSVEVKEQMLERFRNNGKIRNN
jgi:hypothetical protein